MLTNPAAWALRTPPPSLRGRAYTHVSTPLQRRVLPFSRIANGHAPVYTEEVMAGGPAGMDRISSACPRQGALHDFPLRQRQTSRPGAGAGHAAALGIAGHAE